MNTKNTCSNEISLNALQQFIMINQFKNVNKPDKIEWQSCQLKIYKISKPFLTPSSLKILRMQFEASKISAGYNPVAKN